MEEMTQAHFAYMERVLAEYKRGLITGVEFLAELMPQVKEIEDINSYKGL